MKQSGGAHVSTTTWFLKSSMWSLYYCHILAAGKLGSIDLNKTLLEGIITTSLMWDNMTDIYLNI